MPRYLIAEWEYFDGNQDLIIPFTLALVILCAFDAANDVMVAIQVGLL